MNAEISIHNNYYPWTKVKAGEITCWVKGTLFYDDKPIKDDDLVSLFSSVLTKEPLNQESLKQHLLNLNGNFAIIIDTPKWVFATVDRVRSIPIFYTTDKREPIFSDDANYIRNCVNTSFNEENGAEFLVTGFVTGPDTLFDGIAQLQAGEYLVYNKSDEALCTSYYHRFWHKDFFLDSEEELLDRLDESFMRVFQRLVEATKGSPIVVPLSGGLDSRIIVAMLKRFGVENVICFTYGKKGNKEAEISRHVAEALGYQWFFVEYTPEKWYDCYHSDDMKKYLGYAGNFVSLPHIQDFLAVDELKKEGKIPDNAVFVPGHSGDMLAGSHIPQDYNQSHEYNLDKFVNDSLKKHYTLWKWDGNDLKSIFEGKIQRNVGKFSVYDNESCASAIELFDFNERQAKFIINSVRAYEYFGYSWQLPLWDAELIDFFLKVPISFRINQLLYKKYAEDKIFKERFEILQQIECTNSFQNYQKQVKSIHSIEDVFDLYIRNKVENHSFVMNIIRKAYFFKVRLQRILREYDTHPLCWYGIVSKTYFSKVYSGKENINSFIVVFYLKDICPLCLDSVVEKWIRKLRNLNL